MNMAIDRLGGKFSEERNQIWKKNRICIEMGETKKRKKMI
jgi:hypothetical protein